ncbi:hypothetical protein OQA88_12125 [Cercophora sp. LCS_1]
MARLNEPPAPMESNLDILRRKFLRQNRDLAKINSNQSNRIRVLENEYARMLSENLDLRGQILRLEKELESTTAQRIADHALEIKTKMEAQLAELGSMLAGLGSEPPAKRHSPERRKTTKPSPRGLRSPAMRRPRPIPDDPEALAAQEGRLPPIQENKTYPRATMNSEEILALCAEAADTSESPDIGPPPVSRYIEEETTNVKSASTEKGEPLSQANLGRKQSKEPVPAPAPKLDYQRKQPSNPEPKKALASCANVPARVEKEPEQTKPPTQPPSPGTLKAGAKRKYGDENENVKPITKPQVGKENTSVTEKPRDVQKPRVIKELKRDKTANRPALQAKSTNDDISSPRKALQEVAKPSKSQQLQPPSLNDLATKQQKPAPVPRLEIPRVPGPPLPAVTILPSPSPEAKTPGPALISPDTPQRSAQRETARDTPPPGHLSVDGETTRPSRRARAAISYAEPNLRDKMRRPTKELFDAVSGEGKFKQRSSATGQKDDLAPMSATAPEMTLEAQDATRRESVLSPLAPRENKEQPMEVLPSSVVLERRRRPSAVASTGLVDTTEDNTTTIQPKPKPSQEKEKQAEPTVDIYEFASSSPVTSESKGSPRQVEENNKPKRQARRASAAAHQAMRDYAASTGETEGNLQQPKSRVGKKRSSMLAPKKAALANLLDGEYGEGPPQANDEVADKISRRRSMML